MKTRLLFLSLALLLSGCQQTPYNGPMFHLEYVESGALEEITTHDLLKEVKTGKDTIVYFGLKTCKGCINAEKDLNNYLPKAHFKIYHIEFSDVSFEEGNENSYSYLYEMTKNDDYYRFPEDGKGISVPVMLMFKDTYVGTKISSDFVSILKQCVTTD